jgi:hypothetical protein
VAGEIDDETLGLAFVDDIFDKSLELLDSDFSGLVGNEMDFVALLLRPIAKFFRAIHRARKFRKTTRVRNSDSDSDAFQDPRAPSGTLPSQLLELIG